MFFFSATTMISTGLYAVLRGSLFSSDDIFSIYLKLRALGNKKERGKEGDRKGEKD